LQVIDEDLAFLGAALKAFQELPILDGVGGKAGLENGDRRVYLLKEISDLVTEPARQRPIAFL
jgi:hypothetical protein